jgi:predicted AAA+ superfamily ATPase
LDWVLKHKVYLNWEDPLSRSQLLWVSGIPGCGKTVLSAFLINRLKMSEKNTKVAYFFCDDKEEKQKSVEALLRGLIH